MARWKGSEPSITGMPQAGENPTAPPRPGVSMNIDPNVLIDSLVKYEATTIYWWTLNKHIIVNIPWALPQLAVTQIICLMLVPIRCHRLWENKTRYVRTELRTCILPRQHDTCHTWIIFDLKQDINDRFLHCIPCQGPIIEVIDMNYLTRYYI